MYNITLENVMSFAISCSIAIWAGMVFERISKRRMEYKILEKQTTLHRHWLLKPVWVSRTNNPFERDELYILEVSEGYVKYSFKTVKGKQGSRNHYSMPFNTLYSEYKPKK
jgi:hypothetical protein